MKITTLDKSRVGSRKGESINIRYKFLIDDVKLYSSMINYHQIFPTSNKLSQDRYAYLANFVNENRLMRNATKALEVSVNEIKEIEEFNK